MRKNQRTNCVANLVWCNEQMWSHACLQWGSPHNWRSRSMAHSAILLLTRRSSEDINGTHQYLTDDIRLLIQWRLLKLRLAGQEVGLKNFQKSSFLFGNFFDFIRVENSKFEFKRNKIQNIFCREIFSSFDLLLKSCLKKCQWNNNEKCQRQRITKRRTKESVLVAESSNNLQNTHFGLQMAALCWFNHKKKMAYLYFISYFVEVKFFLRIVIEK